MSRIEACFKILHLKVHFLWLVQFLAQNGLFGDKYQAFDKFHDETDVKREIDHKYSKCAKITTTDGECIH